MILLIQDHLLDDLFKVSSDAAAKVKGQNALFTINGLETNRTSNTLILTVLPLR